MSRSLPTTLAALAHRADGQCLIEGQAQNSEKPRRLLGGTRRLTFSKREVQFSVCAVTLLLRDKNIFEHLEGKPCSKLSSISVSTPEVTILK
jgi:hypothetical protein